MKFLADALTAHPQSTPEILLFVAARDRSSELLPALPAKPWTDGIAADAGQATRANTIQEQKMLKIQIDVEGTRITVTLDDNATSRDLVSLLPLTLPLEDYAATEKVSDLPKKLSTDGAPPGITPVTGDLTYYAPWGNLAIFHKDFRYSTGLVKLGKIDSGIALLRRPGPLKATISPVGE